MKTRVDSDRMVVISDLHLGNPFCGTRRRIVQFIEWAAQSGYDVCINGDGFDVAQFSLAQLTRDVPELMRLLRLLERMGKRIYYVVGNHDLFLENFVQAGSVLELTPFLNVTSHGLRVHIEHGHLYDPMFVRSPALYEFLTRLAGVFLKLSPRLYQTWMAFESLIDRLRRDKTGIQGEPASFREAAQEIGDRGFDAVVFGHTHHTGEVDLGEGRRYFNPGAWLLGTHYVCIEGGAVSMKQWDPALRALVQLDRASSGVGLQTVRHKRA